jgi:hypothetical protein
MDFKKNLPLEQQQNKKQQLQQQLLQRFQQPGANVI